MLTARGRRMLENGCAKKRRLNPARAQRRNFGELNRRGRCTYYRHVNRVIVAARRDHRHPTVVLNTVCILVDALMQLRGSTQRECPDKCGENASRHKRAPVIC